MSQPELLHGGLSQLAARLAELGTRRILVITAPSRRFLEPVSAALAGFELVVFDGAMVHVPAAVVEAATGALGESMADTILALGGGAATGLGKALRLTHEVRFAAIPTTYSGSEMTSVHGITTGGVKRTGRDARARPDLILYDARFTAALPIGLTVQSLMNALAHPLSALSTGPVGEARAEALACAAGLLRAIEDLLLWPSDVAARERALAGASAAGLVIERGTLGVHHGLAHLLGGGLALPHAPLHSVLLPQFVSWLRRTQPALAFELETTLARVDLDGLLHDLLTRAGVPTSLAGIGADAAAVAELVAAHPELPAEIARDAQQGVRPTRGRIELEGGALALLAGPRPEAARRVVLGLHGRGAEAGSMVRRLRELGGHAPDIAVLGLRAHGGNRWYGVKYGDPGAGSDPEVARALGEVAAAVAALGAHGRPLVLAGFSQGACLALEYAARTPAGLAAVLAPAGARIGLPAEWAPPQPGALAGLPILLGAADRDPYVTGEHIDASAAWLRAAGATVDLVGSRGERHDITARQRLRARELMLGRPAPAGDTGYGNTVSAEALPGALPPRQNSPRRARYGLYAEQLNGAGFTAVRAEGPRTWLYRVRPSTQRRAFSELAHPHFGAGFEGRAPAVNLTGFAPLPAPEAADFLDGLVTLCGAGSPSLRRGYAVHLYAANRDMERRACYDADGNLLLIPEQGRLTLVTELGPLEVAPGQIAVVPRGVVFSVHLHDGFARGTVAESFGRHFRLPERGLVGANGLADPRHFRAPAPWYEDRLTPDFRIVAKLGGRLYQASQDHSPFDVVAWHGNYVPLVYDLDDFSPLAGVRFDHADPSVYTVLSAPLDEAGAHTLDLVVFAPRWDVTEGTFRPPFFHRNPVSELNGIVREDAAPGSPFQPGVTFLTPCLTAHGVSGRTVERIRAQSDADADRPVRLGGSSLWFQLESALAMSLTPWAAEHQLPSFGATWGSHASFFDP